MTQPLHSITTARLLAEAISPNHFAEIHRLHSDPLVMRTLSADGKPLHGVKFVFHFKTELTALCQEMLARIRSHPGSHNFGRILMVNADGG